MKKELPTTVTVSTARMPQAVYDFINEYCYDKFGKCAESYGLELKLTNIEWEGQ